MNWHAFAVGMGLALSSVGCSGGFEESVGGDEDVGSSQAALTTTYQAENAFDIDEGVIETINAGYRGTGYLNINNFNNTFAWYIVNRPVAGTAAVTVRYANGGTTNRPIRVQAGTAATIAGAPTGSWTTWATATVNVSFSAGNNDLILGSVSNDGMPNVDEFSIAKTFTTTYQAENAFDTEEGVDEAIHAGYTGAGYLNIDNDANTFAWYIVTSPATVPVTVPVTVRYANGTTGNRPISVHTGGTAGAQITAPPTGSWSTWTTATVNITFAPGDNDFFLGSVVSGGMPNIDKFDITW
ncbi:MAG: carbohydrate-binding protein [Myxococcales bacterium]|nr:MAG: carbohydrate-binding protein [Myxococcales bacterium]